MTRAEILAGPCLHEVADIGIEAPAVIIIEPLQWVQPTAILCGPPVNFATRHSNTRLGTAFGLGGAGHGERVLHGEGL